MFIKDTTSFIEPFAVEFDLENGVMRDPKNHIVRRASDMRGHYRDAAALDALVEAGDPLHYEVFEVPVPEEYGHLMYCISTLQPGLVGEECFMTKGHYHTVLETAEIYLCLRGEGYMLMKTPEGRPATERMSRGRMVFHMIAAALWPEGSFRSAWESSGAPRVSSGSLSDARSR
ncbi:MAG: glucose-6-phosphate isomerase family protein, partial [Planctomycetota bacterium]